MMIIREGIGVLTGVLILAGIAFAIANGDKTAKVMTAAGSSFGGLVKAATLQG